MIKSTLITLGVYIAIVSVIYLIFAFIMWEPNCYNWGKLIRTTYICIDLIPAVFIPMSIIILNEKKLQMIRWIEKPFSVNPIIASGYFMEYYFHFISIADAAKINFYKKKIGWEDDINGQFVIIKKYTLLKANRCGWLPKWICRVLINLACIKLIFSNE